MTTTPPASGTEANLVTLPAEPTTLVRSITIGCPAETIYRQWCEEQTLPQLLKDIVEVTPLLQGRTHWHLAMPMGQSLSWDTFIVEDQPNVLVRWQSVEGTKIPNAGSLSLSPAPGEWGTVVTLRFHVDPPGGKIGELSAKLLGDTPALLLGKVLRRFKSLVETGEIPTTHDQPAARKDGRDE
jgi:uncharacterized membrane protein